MDFLITNFATLLEAAAYIIAGASVIVKLTPNTWDDNIIMTIAKVISLNKKDNK